MKRVVIIGYGMAGARLAELVRRCDPAGERVAVTAIGDEKHHPYNRVLLSGVVAGSMSPDAVALQDGDWAVEHDVDLRLGIGVAAIDREARVVFLADGSAVDYDVVVLATGARSWVPPVDGLSDEDGELASGVIAFRSLDDCVRIRHAAQAGEAVAVLGGGLLGLEAASALALCGNRVTVVHPVGHLMERQLDPGAGGVLARVLFGLGIEVRVGEPAVRYVPGRGLELPGGDWVPADLVVVSAGARPETGLARRAGLAVDRGILVDDTLRTSDPRIHAIGDCAQHPGTVSGLVQPAWEQAAVLAGLVTGTDPAARYLGTPVVTKLKARAVDLVALGDAAAVSVDARDADVLCLTDFSRGHYAKLVVRDERVTGAIVLGAPDTAAAITQFYDRGLPVPDDRLALLVGRTTPVLGSVDQPDTAVVCRCNAVTKGALASAWQAGAHSPAELAASTRATTGCGSCADEVDRLSTRWGRADAPA
jgi:assimilatory nitrate reductase electron transfer subunit